MCVKDKRMCFCDDCNNKRFDLLESFRLVESECPSLELYRDGCRCEACVNLYKMDVKARIASSLKGRKKIDISQIEHPSVYHFRRGCRCKGCKDAISAYNHQARVRMKNALQNYKPSKNPS